MWMNTCDYNVITYHVRLLYRFAKGKRCVLFFSHLFLCSWWSLEDLHKRLHHVAPKSEGPRRILRERIQQAPAAFFGDPPLCSRYGLWMSLTLFTSAISFWHWTMFSHEMLLLRNWHFACFLWAHFSPFWAGGRGKVISYKISYYKKKYKFVLISVPEGCEIFALCTCQLGYA